MHGHESNKANHVTLSHTTEDREMTKYRNRLSSFADVENKYANTTPIRGKGKNAGNVPIASRNRAWEEIVKVNDDCYALYDSDAYWWFKHNGNHKKWVDHAAAAVLWTRDRKKNTESVRIRNVGVGMNAFGRIDFLYRFMPMGLCSWRATGSYYYIHDAQSKGDYYLPKTTIHLKDNYDGDPDMRRTWRASGDIPTKYDDMDVTLTRTMNAVGRPEGEWQLTSKPHNQPRKRVDKKTKAAHAKHIQEFLEWCWIRTPVIRDTLRHTTWNERQQYINVFEENSGLTRMVVCDDEHERRMDLLMCFLSFCYKTHYYWGQNTAETEEVMRDRNPWLYDPKKYRTRFNSFINKFCDFTYMTTDY